MLIPPLLFVRCCNFFFFFFFFGLLSVVVSHFYSYLVSSPFVTVADGRIIFLFLSVLSHYLKIHQGEECLLRDASLSCPWEGLQGRFLWLEGKGQRFDFNHRGGPVCAPPIA